MEDYYDILGISHRRADALLTSNDLKQAYRRALLRHHPDKLGHDLNDEELKHNLNADLSFTVDQITTAYKTLSDPVAKAEYDRKLSLYQRQAGVLAGQTQEKYFSGLDIVDLDDLEYDEPSSFWWRSCRCGQDRGFIVTEDELEKDAKLGELITGCKGCSLWLKVLFQAEDERMS